MPASYLTSTRCSHQLYQISEFVNNGVRTLPIIARIEDFGTVIESMLDSSKNNLNFDYEAEIKHLETILNENDETLDQLEKEITDLTHV